MALSSYGKKVVGAIVLGVAVIIAGYVIRGGPAVPNGELATAYSIDACANSSAMFTVPGRAGAYSVYTMRPVIQGELPSTACPAVPVASPPISITLEESDGGGYRKDATYFPTFFLPKDAYALLSFEVVDAKGATLLPMETIQAGSLHTRPPFRLALASPRPRLASASTA